MTDQPKPPSQPPVIVEHPAAGVALVRLNRPGRHNALSADAMQALRQALEGLSRDAALRVLVLTGAAPGFCAGLDLAATLGNAGAAGSPAPSAAEWMALQELFSGAVRQLRGSDKAVIAAVNGAAVGAGFALALAADVRIASRSASFHVGAVRMGLTAGECGISYHLPRCIGASRAFDLMLTGRPVMAEEAGRIGLVSDVVDDARLLDKALEMAASIMQASPYASRHTKQVMWANLDAPSLDAALALENHAQVLGLMTADFREAATAFIEKRAPIFHNR
ncbi:enoyl-CoA hydratase-related protein [Xenophilus azovorans]|uniref:enoyl-CoA hydratase-related protein n=1 Tax=Xenophilus azovorans TaxID=151755 RepID=UPI00068E05AC|nr:enoyl-CoA hydratase-related protein [Xenophilus azovorans]